jgi:hypothetical protein
MIQGTRHRGLYDSGTKNERLKAVPDYLKLGRNS